MEYRASPQIGLLIQWWSGRQAPVELPFNLELRDRGAQQRNGPANCQYCSRFHRGPDGTLLASLDAVTKSTHRIALRVTLLRPWPTNYGDSSPAIESAASC